MNRQWLRIAHRGASGSAPELTRAAFLRALQIGVDVIELDVQLTRDEQLVVIHDLELGRTTSGSGPVRDRHLNELRMLDAGSWFAPAFAGEHVLALPEVLDLVGDRARLNVEIKAPATDWTALAARLIDTLRACGRLQSTVISCFDPDALVAVRERDVQAVLGVLWQAPDFADAWRWAKELRADSLHPFWMLASPDIVRRAHALGLKVLTWTVNDVDAMRTLVHNGVDGLMSDFPERFAVIGGDAES